MRVLPHHPPTESRIRAFLLSLRWRKSNAGDSAVVQSGLHWMSDKAFRMGFAPGDFEWAMKQGYVRRFSSGYCRLLPLGYRWLDEMAVRWPGDTSFPKTGLCDPPNMHKGLPGSDTGRCGCPTLMKI